MSMPVAQSGMPVNITSTSVVTAGPCQMLGFYVNNTSSGTLVLKSGGSSGTAISGTITPAIGWHKFPADIKNGGISATIANTLDVTFFFVSQGYPS